MEAVTAQFVLLRDLLVDGVGVGLGGQRREEGGVEDRDVRHVGQQRHRGLDARDPRGVVQRRQGLQFHQFRDHLIGDEG